MRAVKKKNFPKDLKLFPNHFHFFNEKRRIWPSSDWGTAVRDGKGWYKKEVITAYKNPPKTKEIG
jgi:hypothetical protein